MSFVKLTYAPGGLLDRAIAFATTKHKGQVRRFTGEDYVTHTIHTAVILAGCGITDEEILAGAVLHDTVEDTDATHDEIAANFGATVAAYVFDLTKQEDPDADRVARKEIEHARLAEVSPNAQTIKCADIVSNTCHLPYDEDPKFCKRLIREKHDLLERLDQADDVVYAWAQRSIYEASLNAGIEL